MKIEQADNTIYRIIEASGYQVIGRFATIVLESLNIEYEVVTDIAILDIDTNETIYKKSMCNTSPTKELVFKCIEAFYIISEMISLMRGLQTVHLKRCLRKILDNYLYIKCRIE